MLQVLDRSLRSALAGRPLNAAFACPACGETEEIVPHAVRRGTDGRSYDLWICLACTAVLNSTDLCGAGLRSHSEQADSASHFYGNVDPLELKQEVMANEGVIAFLLEHCPNLGRDAFLDFGAGRGCLAAAATTVFKSAFASELDLTLLQNIHFMLPRSERLTLISDAADLPELDAIGAMHVLEHLPDVKLAMQPSVDRLRVGGALFLQVPMLRNDYLVSTHYTFFGEASIRATCARMGLTVEGVWFDHDNDFLTCLALKASA